MSTFRDIIVEILQNYIQESDDDTEDAQRWLANLPKELILPIGTSTNEDPLTVLVNNFNWLLKYGSIHYCLFDDSSLRYAWFPFIISYNGCKKVTMYLVNLITQQLAVKAILTGGDYIPYHEYPIRYLTNRHHDFILPMKDYSYEYEDESLFEAEFNRIDVADHDSHTTLYLGDEIYSFSKNTKDYFHNGMLLNPKFDADKISIFNRFTTIK
jgi:hypothetical protein